MLRNVFLGLGLSWEHEKGVFFFSSGRFWVSNPIQKTKHALLLCNSLVTFSHACFSNLVPIVNEVFNNHEKKEYGHTSVRHRSVRHVDRTTPEIFSLRRLTLTTPNQKGKCSVFVSCSPPCCRVHLRKKTKFCDEMIILTNYLSNCILYRYWTSGYKKLFGLGCQFAVH